MKLNLSGRKAVVMGGSDGLGYASAHALARAGVALCLVARNPERLDAACAKIKADTGAVACGVSADLTEEAHVHAAVPEVKSLFGAPDILISNGGGPPPNRADNTPPSRWQAQFQAMLYPTLYMADAFLPAMRARGFGRIIMIASISVVRPLKGMAFSNALRAALANWGQTLAQEVAPQGVTVNTLLPGLFNTARIRALTASKEKEGASFLDPNLIPVGRYGEPDELGALAAFLASPCASYITGAMIPVDGGTLVNG